MNLDLAEAKADFSNHLDIGMEILGISAGYPVIKKTLGYRGLIAGASILIGLWPQLLVPDLPLFSSSLFILEL